MKSFSFKIVFIAFVQYITTGTAKPHEGSAEIITCISKLGYQSDTDSLFETFQRDTLPENDEKFTKFYECYWKELGLMDENDNVKPENVKALFVKIFKEGTVGEKKGVLIAEVLTDECKDIEHQNAGIKAIKNWNCIMNLLKPGAS